MKKRAFLLLFLILGVLCLVCACGTGTDTSTDTGVGDTSTDTSGETGEVEFNFYRERTRFGDRMPGTRGKKANQAQEEEVDKGRSEEEHEVPAEFQPHPNAEQMSLL